MYSNSLSYTQVSLAGSVDADECDCNIGTWATELHVTCEPCDPTKVLCDELDQVIIFFVLGMVTESRPNPLPLRGSRTGSQSSITLDVKGLV
jgi:hypothetical protein